MPPQASAPKKDGTLTGVEMELIADIGAHIIQGYSFLGVSIGWLVSLYRFPNVRYKGGCVYTNKAPGCAMQGFGNPQVDLRHRIADGRAGRKTRHGPARAAPEELCRAWG